MENILNSFSQGLLAPLWNAYSGGQLLVTAAIYEALVVIVVIPWLR